MDKFEAFEKLKEYSKDLSLVSYEEIFDLIKNGIKKVPIPVAKVIKNSYIDRARPNNGIELFKNINELGYIKNDEVITNVLTSFGRANCPHQVMFYGAIKTAKIDKPRLTAIAEISHLFRNNSDSLDGIHYTVSRWETNDEFLVAEVVFSEYALKNNPDIFESFEKQIGFLKELNLSEEEIEFYKKFLIFISEEFSKKAVKPCDYKISAAYTNIVLLNLDIKGISYPSVQTEYFGINIVLNPESVDKYLTPKICSTQIVYKNGKNTLITNGEYYCDEIVVSKDIQWQRRDKSLLSDYEEVKRHLKL